MRTPAKRCRAIQGVRTACERSGGDAKREADMAATPAKRLRRPAGAGGDVFDRLPDDLVLTVLAEAAAVAASPADVAGLALTCKRFRELASHPLVLSRASAAAVAVRAECWSEAAHQFLKRCAETGNLEACYFLGMATFYCLADRATGGVLLARAAAGGHAAALYALAVLHFNGSGGSKADKDPRAGVALCARAAWLCNRPALRELGHCLQDGYGVRRDVAAGCRLLLHAAALEILFRETSDDSDTASQFMVEWWTRNAAKPAKGPQEGSDDMELRLCSHALCGRRETRRHEFRRCSVCCSVNYCSRACQALDWKRAHRMQCLAAARWLAGNDN